MHVEHSHDAQCMKALACPIKVSGIYILCTVQDHALVLESLMYSNPLLTLGLPYLLKNYICPASGTFSCRSSQTPHGSAPTHSFLLQHCCCMLYVELCIDQFMTCMPMTMCMAYSALTCSSPHSLCFVYCPAKALPRAPAWDSLRNSFYTCFCSWLLKTVQG